MKTIKAVNPKIEDDCNCGKQIRKSERKKIIYKKIIKRR